MLRLLLLGASLMVAGNTNSVYAFERDCDGFAAQKCTPDMDKYLGTRNAADEDACQGACKTEDDCLYYTWNSNEEGEERCKLYSENYRQNCAVYAGSMETQLDICIKQTQLFRSDCDRFMMIDCEYEFTDDQIVEEANRGSIVDAYHCQEYCEIFVDSGCNYWVFEDSETAPLKMSTCKLYNYDFKINKCKVHHGPDDPPTFSESCEVIWILTMWFY